VKARFVSPANIELNETLKYYDHQLPGLGFRFFQEVNAAIERIRIMPEAWTKVGKRTRRCMLKGFPYAMLYVIERDEIIVTALAHLHRNPDHYKDRIV
jgi:hypothetical protein